MNAKQVANGAYGRIEQVADNAILRLVSRLAMAAMVPVAFWYMTQFNELQRSQSVISTRQQALEDVINDRTTDRYTGSQAARDWMQQNARDNRQDADRARIENRADRHESVPHGR